MTRPTIEQAFAVAIAHHQAGELEQAENLYRQILAEAPGHGGALHHLGVIALQRGRPDAALELIRQAIAIEPGNANAYSNLGNALRKSGEREQAIAAYRTAIGLKPDFAEAFGNLGVTLAEQNRLEEAIAAYRQAIALRPNFAKTHHDLGNALRDKGRTDEAMAAYRQAIALSPNDADAHNNLGNLLSGVGRADEAIAAYERAIAANPRLAEARTNLGNVLWQIGRLDEAIAACRAAIDLKPSSGIAFNTLGNALKDSGRVEEALAAFEKAMAIDPADAVAHSNLIYTLHFSAHCDAGTIAQRCRGWERQHAEPLRRDIPPHTNDRSPQRRLRIGYVSADLRLHPVGRFLSPLLAHHDKSQVEIFAYAQVVHPDATTERLRSHIDAWRDIGGLADAQVADLIRQDQIDILVDLTMHMANNRMLVFARKPAPVQVTYLAYCSTTGLETIDYRLSDPYLDEAEADETLYSEKTVRLAESYWCYEPISSAPPVGPLPALERGFVTFGCLNNLCKVTEGALSAWAGILHAVADSQLLLHARGGSHRQMLLDRLQRNGIEPGRVRFADFLPVDKYLELNQQIDIALDSFPYGGGTTTLDALWMGVPVISLAGKTAVGRGGLSILSNLGLAELVADAEEEYVRRAGELAGDLDRLSTLRSTLRGRMERSPLMDAAGFARNIESAYRLMWRTWCGRP
jgi:predicted O-linked N-acetylglucosamine transferase (SPINDLY family)